MPVFPDAGVSCLRGFVGIRRGNDWKFENCNDHSKRNQRQAEPEVGQLHRGRLKEAISLERFSGHLPKLLHVFGSGAQNEETSEIWRDRGSQ